MIKAGSVQSGYSFELGNMTNPYQYTYGTNTFYTQIWKNGRITNKFYTNYNAAVITSDPISGEPLNISFTPTLTPDYQLKYGFNNIAKITFTHLLQNSQIQMIYIEAGSEITFDQEYCNVRLINHFYCTVILIFMYFTKIHPFLGP